MVRPVKLYNQPVAPNPPRVRIFAAEKGIQLALEDVDILAGQSRTPEFLAKNADDHPRLRDCCLWPRNDPGWRLELRYVGNSRRAGSAFQALRSRNCNASWRLRNGRPCAGFAIVTPNICKGLVGGR